MLSIFATNVQPFTGNLCTDIPGFCDWYDKTAGNISPLYQLDAFDWTILILYFGILTVLSIYGVYRVKQVSDFWRYSKYPPKPKGQFAQADLPFVTVQLPEQIGLWVSEDILDRKSTRLNSSH